MLVFLLAGCKKKEQQSELPVDEVLTEISLHELEPGHFYVKNGDNFYKLPFEYSNFDVSKQKNDVASKKTGIVNEKKDRLLSFTHYDLAIPTLYRNDQLVYVADGLITNFIWERYLDCGYSIAFSELKLKQSGEITYQPGQSSVSPGSSLHMALAAAGAPSDMEITLDAINGITLSDKYLKTGGIISGLSKDSDTVLDAYIGTSHAPLNVMADTRFFQAFERYETTKYHLSTDGYAVIEIPDYLKSSYYLINQLGCVKFLNVDRGVDESGIDLTIPYYYLDDDGKTVLTYFEWITKQGGSNVDPQPDTPIQGAANEQYHLSIDQTQKHLQVQVRYVYRDEFYAEEAKNNGRFPQVTLSDPLGETVILSETTPRSHANKDSAMLLESQIDGAVAGTWTLNFYHFENIDKSVEVTMDCGNASSFVHSGTGQGKLEVYFDAVSHEVLFHIKWENTNRAASVKLTTPDGTVYSNELTPEHMVEDSFGRISIRTPEILHGNYKVEINGENLGRVWLETETVVPVSEQEIEDAAKNDSVAGESGPKETISKKSN